MSRPDLVLLDRHDRVAVLTLNRPERHNALVPELLEALLTQLGSIDSEKTDAIVLQAKGGSFSTGGDVAGFWKHRDRIAPYAEQLVGLLNRTIRALQAHPVPVICAVTGQVCGGSLGLLLAADLVVLAPTATITPYYAVVGFAPDGGWTAMLPQRIGKARAAELLLTNGTLSPVQAEKLGLASRVADNAREIALELAGSMARLKPGSLQASKRLLAGDRDAIERGLEAERTAFVQQIQSEEAFLGMQQFLEDS